ncbi:hypothetical protein [Brucella rhizosphaerae]|uniref:Uncharacterized protein n=1 Tax=Brucella rhizosphaerae TaxID=571254 RepID=A0A256F3T1_9HYPH|nr:hypothetical protein [Brucella rhizosphaerae]OYR09502.1 hypothetical protein CEV32_1932 [Brucella rhizosphaerae]
MAGAIMRQPFFKALPEKYETVFGQDARKKQMLRRADLIQSDRTALYCMI